MKTIYQNAVAAVENGARFQVDFRTRSLKIDGKYVISDGNFEGELGVEKYDEEKVLLDVEALYQLYKYSIPSERSESKARKYFKSLPESELMDDDMMFGEQRDKAQIELELYLLCQIILGFQWDAKTMGTWFWQSKNDKDLVILREWVEPSNK